MGLHVDIDRIAADNRKRQGCRKFGFLVNQLGKLPPAEKKALIEANRLKYGLTEEEVDAIKLPAPCHLVQVYDITKIMNPRLKLSTLEKINHCINLKEALESKLEMIREGILVNVGSSTGLGAGSKRGRPAASSSSGGMMKLMGKPPALGIYASIPAPVRKDSDVDEDEHEPQDEDLHQPERVPMEPKPKRQCKALGQGKRVEGAKVTRRGLKNAREPEEEAE